jgi:hypothetical protein
MTLRANITTTYQEANANPPRAIKNVQKKAADQGVHESEGNRDPMKPALKTTNRGAVSLTEQRRNRPAVRNSGQNSATLDVFKRSSPKDKLIVAQGAGSDKPASDSSPDTNEGEVALKPALAGYGPGPGKPITKRTVEELPTSQKRSATVADRSQDMQSGSMVKKVAPFELTKTDESQMVSSDDKPKAPESLSQSLPIATPPKIRLAGPSAKVASDNAVASFSNVDSAPATVSTEKSDQSPSGVVSGLVSNSTDEDAMQRELTAAFQFGQSQEDNSQTDSATGSDVAKHLQSEGVFGISASGRNLGTVDFIRQKQFEYTMDQKPFTTDDLLLEAEKAIHGTLDSDQSSAVSKSLLQAAESINAYRNQSVRSSEHAEMAAKSVRVAASTSKEKA